MTDPGLGNADDADPETVLRALQARASSAEAEIERLREIEGANIINKNALKLCRGRLSAREG